MDENDIQTLVKLGLSNAEAKIYLSLIALGIADAKKIASTAEIDRGETYRRIENLQKKALIEKIISYPIRFKPISLDEAINSLLQQKNQENRQIYKEAKKLLKKNSCLETLNDEETKISIIPCNFIKQYIAKATERIEKEWLWYTPIERIPTVITTFWDSYKKGAKRGIQWRTIAEVNKPANQALKFIQDYKKENPSFHIKFSRSNLLVTFALRDDKELDFFTKIPNEKIFCEALYTNNPQLIKVVKGFFESIWNSTTDQVEETFS